MTRSRNLLSLCPGFVALMGPGLLMGRIAAREVVAQMKLGRKSFNNETREHTSRKTPAANASDPESLRAWREVLRQLLAQPRPGFLHFEKAHAVVLERNFDCARCHRESSPLALTAEQLDRQTLIQACVISHRSVKE